MPERDACDRARQALEGIGQWESFGTTLAVWVGHHTCGTGVNGHYGAHEPGCGLEPIAECPEPVARFAAAATVLLPELVAEVEQLRANQRVEIVEDWHGIAKGSN